MRVFRQKTVRLFQQFRAEIRCQQARRADKGRTRRIPGESLLQGAGKNNSVREKRPGRSNADPEGGGRAARRAQAQQAQARRGQDKRGIRLRTADRQKGAPEGFQRERRGRRGKGGGYGIVVVHGGL